MSQGQSGASDAQRVSTFLYLENLPLTIQTRVLSSVVKCLFGVSTITHAEMVLCLRGAAWHNV